MRRWWQRNDVRYRCGAGSSSKTSHPSSRNSFFSSVQFTFSHRPMDSIIYPKKRKKKNYYSAARLYFCYFYIIVISQCEPNVSVWECAQSTMNFLQLRSLVLARVNELVKKRCNKGRPMSSLNFLYACMCVGRAGLRMQNIVLILFWLWPDNWRRIDRNKFFCLDASRRRPVFLFKYSIRVVFFSLPSFTSIRILAFQTPQWIN